MKKHPLDKTRQQFKLGERVFAAARRGRADCLVEGGICGVFKQAAETGISGRLQNQVRTSHLFYCGTGRSVGVGGDRPANKYYYLLMLCNTILYLS